MADKSVTQVDVWIPFEEHSKINFASDGNFTPDDDERSICRFYLVNFQRPKGSRKEVADFLELSPSRLIMWAVQVLGCDAAAIAVPHQYIPVRAMRSSPKFTGPASQNMREAVEAYRGVYGPATPPGLQRLLSCKRPIQLGSVTLNYDSRDEVFRFSSLEFSFRMACEFASYILRDKLTADESPRYHFPWLIVRDNVTSAWQGNDLASGEPLFLPKHGEEIGTDTTFFLRNVGQEESVDSPRAATPSDLPSAELEDDILALADRPDTETFAVTLAVPSTAAVSNAEDELVEEIPEVQTPARVSEFGGQLTAAQNALTELLDGIRAREVELRRHEESLATREASVRERESELQVERAATVTEAAVAVSPTAPAEMPDFDAIRDDLLSFFEEGVRLLEEDEQLVVTLIEEMDRETAELEQERKELNAARQALFEREQQLLQALAEAGAEVSRTYVETTEQPIPIPAPRAPKKAKERRQEALDRINKSRIGRVGWNPAKVRHL